MTIVGAPVVVLAVAAVARVEAVAVAAAAEAEAVAVVPAEPAATDDRGQTMSEPTHSRRSILMGLGLLLALAGCKHRGATWLPDAEGGGGAGGSGSGGSGSGGSDSGGSGGSGPGVGGY